MIKGCDNLTLAACTAWRSAEQIMSGQDVLVFTWRKFLFIYFLSYSRNTIVWPSPNATTHPNTSDSKPRLFFQYTGSDVNKWQLNKHERKRTRQRTAKNKTNTQKQRNQRKQKQMTQTAHYTNPWPLALIIGTAPWRKCGCPKIST